MKRMIMIPTIMTLIVVLFGCTRVKNLADINIDIPYNTEVTIPDIKIDTPIRMSASIDLPTIALATNSKQYMEQYHTNPSNVRQVDLKELGIQILMPPTGNFDFMDTVQLYLSAQSQPEVLIAYQYQVRQGMNNLDLIPVADQNLKEYFLADTMYIRMRTVINATPENTTKINVKSTFHLLANPLY